MARLSDNNFTLTANETRTINIGGGATGLMVSSATGDFEIRLDSDGSKFKGKSGIKTNGHKTFHSITVTDKSGATNIVEMYMVLGNDGEVEDTSLKVEGSLDSNILVSDTVVTAADQSIVNVTATSVAIANSIRKEIWLQPVTLGAGWRCGDSNVSATRGILIPDAGLVVETTAQIFVFQNSGAAATIAVNELTKV